MTKTWEAEAREHARAILTEALMSVTPQALMRERISHQNGVIDVVDSVRLDFSDYGKVRLAAVGKAAAGMAAQAQMWTKFEEAVVVTPEKVDVFGFEVMQSDHPTPTERSVRAGERVLELAKSTGENDLLILLISGGGSALAEVPAVPLDDLMATTKLLLRAAAPIQDVNVVRKHLSDLKGGRLAQACRGRLVAFSISDVVGDDPALIASGPAAADPSTFAEAVSVLRKHDLWDAVPASVRAHLERGLAGEVPETPKPKSTTFTRVTNHVLAGNVRAVERAASTARRFGYEPYVLHEFLQGEARDVGNALADLARAARRGELPVRPPCAIVAGGETVVNVRGDGKGGRSQELALAAVDKLSGAGVVLAAFGTDGIDGPTDAAGAIVDSYTLARAQKAGVDVREHLENNDAYRFFEALSDLVVTGPTGTNVRDVALVLVGPQ